MQTGAIKHISYGVYLQPGAQANPQYVPNLTSRVKTHLIEHHGPFTASELSHLSPESAVATVLRALVKSGHLARVRTGVYVLPAHTPADPYIPTAKKIREAIRQHPTDGPFQTQTFKDYGSKIAVQSALEYLARKGELIHTRRNTYVRAPTPTKPQTSPEHPE